MDEMSPEQFPVNRQQVLTLEEIDSHRDPSSCYLVAHGRVYDVTSWLDHHPAGAACILRHAGARDSSQDFEFHSPAARAFWKRFEIGTVEGHRHTTCSIL